MLERTIWLAWRGGSGRSGGGSHWPCPSPTHCSCLLILGPARWSVRHSDGLDTLCLSLTQSAARNVSGNSLVRGKVGVCSAALAAFIAPTAHKGMERGRTGHGRVWQVVFLASACHWPGQPPLESARLQIRLQLELELASPITVVLDSLYALTVCALCKLRWSLLEVSMGRVIVAYGHPSGASRTAP